MAEQVVLAIGDAAGSASSNPGAVTVASLAQRLIAEDPSAIVLLLGDNAYDDGSQGDYDTFFASTYGRPAFNGRMRACAGNHDYHTAGALPYFSVLGTEAAGTPGVSYYSFDAGDWHIISLNSEVEQDQDSPQLQWLRQDLATRTRKPVLAFWHRPRWGSGGHRDSRKPRWFWKELFAHRAEVVLNGHAHHYERFAPQTPDQAASPTGIREFIVGTGGRKLAGRTKVTPNSEVANFASFGLLKLTLAETEYRWEFLSPAGDVLDQGRHPTNDASR